MSKTPDPFTPSGTNDSGLAKCPHCDHSLTTKDVKFGRCWFCEKRLTDPVEPRPPRGSFVARMLFGMAGAILGMMAGVLLNETGLRSSWTVSICAGLGFASGSALARLMFSVPKQE